MDRDIFKINIDEKTAQSSLLNPEAIEREANTFLAEGKHYDAFRSFKKAALIFKQQHKHKQAALCFASAANSWSIRAGEKTLYNAAILYEKAAKEAKNSNDLEYASFLYKNAAINYEKDMDFDDYEECYYHSKELYRKFLERSILHPRTISPTMYFKENPSFTKRIFLWLTLTISYLLWGHGERPIRTLLSGLAIVFLSAFLFTFGHLLANGEILKPGFFEALYFSTVTFTTVGFGDITPVGGARLVVMLESICGLLIIPLYIIGLSRKYLRV
jgi:tetratricopeptide (TPR) repeat protein